MKKSVLVFLLLAACAPVNNSTISPIQGKNGAEKGTMNISFQTDFGGGNGKVTAAASDGEIFNGNVIGEKTESRSSSESEGTGVSGNVERFHTNAHSGRSSKYSPNAKAVLIGNRGHSMKCSFTLNTPSLGITGGAVGECKISDGRVVPVSFSRK